MCIKNRPIYTRSDVRHKPETKTAVAMDVKNFKFSLLFALLAEKKRLFLSDRLVKIRYTAASALYPQHGTTIKSLIVSLEPGKVYLLLARKSGG